MCKEKGIWIFSDEVYGLIGAKSTPSASLYDKALSLNVMSKSFGLPGLRIGWIACQDKEMLHKMKCMKDYLSICNSGPSEVLALIALRNKDAILARNNKIVSDNLALLDKFFVEYNHLFEWVRPTGGCVGFVKYKRPESTNSFCDRAVRTKNLLLMPGSVYGDYNSYFRIGFGKKNMPECLEIFKEFLSNENTES
jgi:aspartate/methionine/tyrosine aminotransferase